MRRILPLLTIALACSLALADAQTKATESKDPLIGIWTGTFAGTSTGKYTMAFSLDESKNVAGTLVAVPDGGVGYTVKFKTIDVSEDKVSLAYDDPNGSGEVQLEGTLDDKSMKGRWKSLDAAKKLLEAGTFKGTKG